MPDVPVGAHPCATCPRHIWGKVEQCGSCVGNAKER
jgi:hypothetical protein